MLEKRGSRRAKAARSQRVAPPRRDAGGRGAGFWLKRLFLWGIGLALLAALFLGIAVAFAARSLPNFYQLKATQAGQTIVCLLYTSPSPRD